MKNVRKLLGIIALTAVISFSFVTCDDSGDSGSSGAPNCVHAWQTITDVNTSTCTESGKKITLSCLKCFAVVEGDVTPPKGHSDIEIKFSIQPSETTDGKGTWNCSRYGCSATSVTIPAWNKFYGTWKYSTSAIVISKTEMTHGGIEYIIDSWVPQINTGSNEGLYPNGYLLKAKFKSNNNSWNFYLYMSKFGDSFIIKSDGSNSFTTYVKQQY